MATGARTFGRVLQHARPCQQSFRLSTRQNVLRRGFASGPESAPSKGKNVLLGVGAVAAAGVAGTFAYSQYTNQDLSTLFGQASANAKKEASANNKGDYQKVYDEIARLLVEKDDYDDGSYGPVLVRLAWHASGTYDAMTGTGGSNGATMRFAPESDHGANAGLKHARDFLEPVKGWFNTPTNVEK